MASDALADILAKASRKYDGLTIGNADTIVEDLNVISTGNLAIDTIIGVGGLPLGRSIELYGPPSCGKSLDVDAPVLTPDRGFIRMGDIALGDRVVDPEGDTTNRVIGIFPQGVLPVYRLTFSDGSWAEASGDHLWDVWEWSTLAEPKRRSRREGECADCGDSEIRVRGLCISCYSKRSKSGALPPKLTSQGRQNRKRAFVRKVLTTDEMRTRLQNSRTRIQLPTVAEFDFDQTEELSVDPYVLGAILGDGSVVGRGVHMTIGAEDSEYTLGRLRDRLPKDVQINKYSSKEYGLVTYTKPNSLKQKLVELGVTGHAWEKFVPERYKMASFRTRLDVLQGLMDTDGNWAAGIGEFNSTSEQLRDDVVWLARSLGMTAKALKPRRGSYRDKEGNLVECRMVYRATFQDREEVRAFSMPRKLRELRNGPGRRRLVSIEYVEDRECQCIKVSARSELFMTRDFIPTHNTTTALQAAAELQKIIRSGGDEKRGIGPNDRILYWDYEQTIDKAYALALGFDMDHETVLLSQPETLEQGTNLSIEVVKTGRIRMIIFDSMAAMNPSAKAEAEIGKSLPAVQAKLMKDFTMNMNFLLSKNNCVAIYLNHQTEVMSMGGRPGMPPKISTPGGAAPKYFASLRIQYTRIRENKGTRLDPLTNMEQEFPISSDVIVKIVKNKVAPFGRSATVRVRFGRGFDNFWSAMQVLIANKKVVHTGGYYYFDKLAEQGLVTDWMQRAVTGKQRPYVLGEDHLYSLADKYPDWRDGMIGMAELVVKDNVEAIGSTETEDATDPIASEDLDVGLEEIMGSTVQEKA
jgi:RecA/RadA recombinase